MDDEQQIDAERLDMPRLGAEGRQAEGRRIRLEHAEGMGIEGEHGMRNMEAAGYPASLGYHRLMARMDAVEITDGDSGAAVRTLCLVMSEDAHA
jgi:hypothetical protein